MTATAAWTEPAGHLVEHPAEPHAVLADEVAHHVARLARTLSGGAPEPTMLQALVLDFPARFGVATAILTRSRSDGTLQVTSWYGVPELGDDVPPFPASDGAALSHVLRTREPHVWPTVEAMLDAFPDAADGPVSPRPGACVRLEHHGVPVGTLGLGTDRAIEDVAQMRRLMAVTAALVGTQLGHASRAIVRPDRERPSTADDVRLTTRQLAVLGLMAEGMSNRQISLRVGYSESTVRHETMAIYRALGVGDRRTAALLALELGLVG